MDPLTIGLALGGASALMGGAQGLLNRSSAKKQAQAYNNAINLMREQMNRKYSGLYGAEATADSMSTGDVSQDALLAALAREVQARELQAARINMGSQNLTDRQAQAQALVELLLQNRYQNGQALANASINSRRMGLNNAGNLVWQAANSQAKGAQNAYLQSRQATNNNLARIGQGTNLNTGSIADMNRQQAQNMYQNANANYQAAANNLANLYTQQGQAKANVPTYGGILTSSLMSGLQTGIPAYGMAKAFQYYPNNVGNIAGKPGTNTSVNNGYYRG